MEGSIPSTPTSGKVEPRMGVAAPISEISKRQGKVKSMNGSGGKLKKLGLTFPLFIYPG